MQIVALRSTVKRAKNETIRKLVKQMKQYRNRKFVSSFFVWILYVIV